MRVEALEAIKTYIESNSSSMFAHGATAVCNVHAKSCPVCPLAYHDLQSDTKTLAATDPAARRLQMASAGVTCTAFSREGLQRKETDESMIYHEIWMAERKVRTLAKYEDLVWVECTPRYPMDRLPIEKIGKHMKFVSITDGPELHGRPQKRLRALGCGINQFTYRWCGPDTDEEIAMDYARRFHRGAVLDGSDFFFQTDVERRTEYGHQAM